MNKSAEKLVRLDTHRLPNELHFMFMVENRGLYDKFGVAALGIDPFMGEYSGALSDEDTALEVVRKSADTERIAAADVAFDRTFLGLYEQAKANLRHYDPAARHAAENLWVVFEHFGNIAREAYHQELGASANLLEDLRARPADYAASGLAPWAEAHEHAASALAALLAERNEELAQQSSLRMREVRLRMDAAYQKVTDRLDARINLDGRGFAGGFYAEYNTHATEYKNKLAQHLGRVRKEAEGGDAIG
ncbi:MAG: DUF6261 family protein [Prevotellaceae bacterium]|jgi:hypothetical protein|nr:DUF6261 family protein [Prevotellaceae bacterium]